MVINYPTYANDSYNLTQHLIFLNREVAVPKTTEMHTLFRQEKELCTLRSGNALYHQLVQQQQQKETQTKLLTEKSTSEQNNPQVKKLWQQQRIAEIHQHEQDQLERTTTRGI